MSSGESDHPVSLLREMYGAHTVLFHKSAGQEPEEYARSLLGRQVRVVVGYTADGGPDIGEERGISVLTEGKLLGFGQGGDFEILEDDGFVHYCWPMLKIEPR